MIRPVLPPRGTAEEDAFVWALMADSPATATLVELVGEAIDAGRPQLAARLVGLLPDDAIDDDDIRRARAAARFVVQGTRDPQSEDEAAAFDAAWQRFRERRLTWRRRLGTEPWGRNPLEPFPRSRRRRR